MLTLEEMASIPLCAKLFYVLIEKVSYEEDNIAERLHEIDPVLVNLWRNSSSNRNLNSEKNPDLGEFPKHPKIHRV